MLNTPQTFPEVLKGFLFSMASRRFVLALIGAIVGYFGPKYGLTNEQIAFVLTPLGTFILGESINDAARNRGTTPDTVTAGGDVTIEQSQSTPQSSLKQKLKGIAIEELQEELRERGYGVAGAIGGAILGGHSLQPADAAPYIETLPEGEAENYQIEETKYDDGTVIEHVYNPA